MVLQKQKRKALLVDENQKGESQSFVSGAAKCLHKLSHGSPKAYMGIALLD